jgi:pimeloyl-ACP methyl ester carboxylesterase
VPEYIKTEVPGRMSAKYNLYRYRLRESAVSDKLHGTPVLFIPGNAGSFRQGAPIASFFDSSEYLGDNPFDFFLADFTDDLTAFHGNTLLDQAEFVNDAVQAILDNYLTNQFQQELPESVIILAHSMGGIVARTIFTLPGYKEGSVNTVLTLSSPHVLAPVSFEQDVSRIYDRVNQYWRYAMGSHKDTNLSNVTLISIAGGQNDRMVPSDYTVVESLVRKTNGFTAFTYSMPYVWSSIDHLAIMWCGQFRKVLCETLVAITDSSTASRTLALDARMRIFERYLLSGPYDRGRSSTPIYLEVNADQARSELKSTARFSLQVVDHIFPLEADVKAQGLWFWTSDSLANSKMYLCHEKMAEKVTDSAAKTYLSAECHDMQHKVVYLPSASLKSRSNEKVVYQVQTT